MLGLDLGSNVFRASSSLSPALPHVRPPEDDLKVIVEADGVRGDVGVPRHGHEPLAIQRPHRQEVGDDLALRLVLGLLLVQWSAVTMTPSGIGKSANMTH